MEMLKHLASLSQMNSILRFLQFNQTKHSTVQFIENLLWPWLQIWKLFRWTFNIFMKHVYNDEQWVSQDKVSNSERGGRQESAESGSSIQSMINMKFSRSVTDFKHRNTIFVFSCWLVQVTLWSKSPDMICWLAQVLSHSRGPWRVLFHQASI